MWPRNIHFYSCFKDCLKCHNLTDLIYIILNRYLCEQASHIVQRYTWGRRRATLAEGNRVQAGVHAMGEWRYVCADSVQTLCYHYCAATVVSPPQRRGLGVDKDDYCCGPPTRYSAALGLCKLAASNLYGGIGLLKKQVKAVLLFIGIFFVDFSDRLHPPLRIKWWVHLVLTIF